MQRVAIIGSPGSGKSVLARQLGQVTGLAVYHLDRLYWRPGWVPTPRDEWRAIQSELVSHGCWIIDGNYGGTMQIRLQAADTVVFLDYPRLTCLFGVFKRFFEYRQRQRPDMASGNNERLTIGFLKWVWIYPKTDRPRVLEHLAQLPPATRIVRLRSRWEAQRFLAALRTP